MDKEKLERINAANEDLERLGRAVSYLDHYNSTFTDYQRGAYKDTWWARAGRLFQALTIEVSKEKIEIVPQDVYGCIEIDTGLVKNDELKYEVALMRARILDFIRSEMSELETKARKIYEQACKEAPLNT